MKPLTLIGIVSASTLQNWKSFDGSVGFRILKIVKISKIIS